MMSQMEPPLLEAVYLLLDAWRKLYDVDLFFSMLETLLLLFRPVVSPNKAMLIFL